MNSIAPSDDERVLVLAPTPADAALTRTVLRDAGVPCALTTDLYELARSLAEGAGALLLTEESLTAEDGVADLIAILRAQPTWSDVPILLLASSRSELSA